MSTANLELAQRGYDALKRGDWDELTAMLDEDVKWHAGDPTAEGACQDKQQTLAWLRRPGRGAPEVVEMIDAGDQVVVILRPPPVDGESSPLRAQVTTFRDGKVVEMVGYPSVEAALAAAGIDQPQ